MNLESDLEWIIADQGTWKPMRADENRSESALTRTANDSNALTSSLA